MDYVSPGFSSDAFNCPHCHTYAHMVWEQLFCMTSGGMAPTMTYQAVCQKCEKPSIWLCTTSETDILAHRLTTLGRNAGRDIPSFAEGILLHPPIATAPMPSPDLPEDCKADYMEARDLVSRSPRAAAALLRLLIQKLCKHFGEQGKNIDTDIGNLVKKGLPAQIQQALDTVRVIGNESVHPGELNLNDNPAVASTLFKLVNMIVTKMITDPREYNDLYQALPKGKLAGIAQRDKP